MQNRLFKKKTPKKWEFGKLPEVKWLASNKTKFDMVLICKLILTQILKIDDVSIMVVTDDNFCKRFDTEDIEIKAILQGYPVLKKYILYLKSDISNYELLSVICHEMVHLSQYNSGKLKLEGTTFKWEGKSYNHVSYWERPWEKEAKEKQYDIEKQVRKLYE